MADSSLRPLPREEFDYWKAQHLLNRAGFGGTPMQVRALADMGLNDAVDYIVDFEGISFESVTEDEFDRNIMRPPTPDEVRMAREARQSNNEAVLGQIQAERQRRQVADRRQVAELQKWWLRRMIMSPRPLEEKLTLFWHGHFATGYRAIEDSFHMFQQNQLFRAYAVGDFKELTHRIIRDPAMIAYLNNNQNRRQASNENLARELMELFTLGEGNAYTERDIKEGARALTGYTFYDDEFRFIPEQHDPGAKRILGASGRFDGDGFLDVIFRRDECSQFICYKLYRYFVNDLPGTPEKPTQEFILRLAAEFRKSKFELKPVLKTLFRSRHFFDAENTSSLVKSPLQLIVQAIRSLHTPTRDMSVLVSAADLMGQNLFQPPSVKGWDGGRAWINTSTLFVRHNMLIYLLTGQRPNAYNWQADTTTYNAMHLVEELKSPDSRLPVSETVHYLLRFCFGTEPHPDRRTALVQFVEQHGGRIDNDMMIALLSLITAMPEYQLC